MYNFKNDRNMICTDKSWTYAGGIIPLHTATSITEYGIKIK